MKVPFSSPLQIITWDREGGRGGGGRMSTVFCKSDDLSYRIKTWPCSDCFLLTHDLQYIQYLILFLHCERFTCLNIVKRLCRPLVQNMFLQRMATLQLSYARMSILHQLWYRRLGRNNDAIRFVQVIGRGSEKYCMNNLFPRFWWIRECWWLNFGNYGQKTEKNSWAWPFNADCWVIWKSLSRLLSRLWGITKEKLLNCAIQGFGRK